MAKVVAVDAGTTGVRALAVDERAGVTDVAYRELTQHFPRPGWVEHDPAEIWQAVRATLAEVGARLADGRRARWRPSGSPTSARPWWPSTAPPAAPCTAPSCGRTAVPRPSAPSSPRPATCRSCAPHGPRPRSVLQRHQGGLAPAPRRPRPRRRRPGPLASARSTAWVLWNLTGGAGRRHLRHRPLQRQPHPPPRYVHARLVRRALRPLRRAAAHAARGAAIGRALRHRRARRPRSRRRRARRGAGLGRARRPAGRALRAGLLRAGHGQGDLRHRQLRAGQRRPRPPAAARGPHRQLRLGPRRRTRRADGRASPTRSRGRPSSPARPSSGCATGSASSRRRPRSARWPRRSPTAAASPSSRRSPASAARGGTPPARGIVTGLTRGAGRAQLARACVEAMAFQVRDMTDAMAGRQSPPRPLLRAAGGRGRRRHGPPPRAAGRAEPPAGGAAALARVDRARCRHHRRAGRGRLAVARRARRVWEAEAVFEPQLPAELADAVHAVWRRAVEKSRGWADPDGSASASG